MKIEVPIRIESVANLREHWSQRAKRSRLQRAAVRCQLLDANEFRCLPCTVTLTRIAPRALDTDNLASGCKAARDGVADWLGVNDADPRVTWVYAQVAGKPKEYALRVEIVA